LVLIATASLVVCAAPALAAPTLPPQGLYDACAPASSPAACSQHLQAIGQAGFQVVLNYSAWSASPRQLLDYANTAQSLGMKVIWPLDDAVWRNRAGSLAATHPALSAGCACSGDDAFLSYAINLVKNLPATWGYYIGDEVPADQLGQVQALAAKLKALDPNHPQLLIADGTSEDAVANLAPFADAADVVGSDVYPIGWPVSPAEVAGTVAAADQAIAAADQRQVAVALQAFSWSQDPSASTATDPRWPTEQEMQTMRDAVLANSDPALILWFSYADIAASDDPAGHWLDLVMAAFADLPAPAAATSSPPPASPLAPALPETTAHEGMRAVGAAARRGHDRRHGWRRRRR
jgi:hypothetical protein